MEDELGSTHPSYPNQEQQLASCPGHPGHPQGLAEWTLVLGPDSHLPDHLSITHSVPDGSRRENSQLQQKQSSAESDNRGVQSGK